MPDRLHFTGNDEADAVARAGADGAADRVRARPAGAGADRLRGPVEAEAADRHARRRPDRRDRPGDLEAAFREKPAIHRFPGTMATRVQDLASFVAERYGGRAERLWTEAADAEDLARAGSGSCPGSAR